MRVDMNRENIQLNNLKNISWENSNDQKTNLRELIQNY